MPNDNHTRVSTGGRRRGGGDQNRPLRARITIERRMGRAVEGEAVSVLFGNQMLVGRDKTADIPVIDDRISRKHALIRIDADAVRLTDLGSTNGTFRNKEAVTEEIILENEDLVCFGQGRTFETRIVERDGVITSVRLASGPEAYLLVPQEMIIGFADPEAHDVDLKIYDPTILPKHVRLEFFAGQTFVVSLDAQALAVVNSNPVRELELRNNYLLEIGDTLLRFERLE